MAEEPAEHPSDTYTHGHHESVLKSHSWRTAENSAGYLLPHLKPGMSILDLGCGPGTITLDLGKLVAPGEVVGIDVSAAVIDEARNAQAAESQTNVSFTTGDAYDTGFADDSFDVVHAHQVLQHVSDPVALLIEMRRVVKPGGIVAARDADYAAMSWWPQDPRLDRWNEIYRAVAKGNDAEPDAARHLVDWATHAGFGQIEASADTWAFANPTDRLWWGGLWAERTTSSGMAEQAIERGISTAEELDHVAGGFREWSVHPTSWFAVINGEVLCRA